MRGRQNVFIVCKGNKFAEQGLCAEYKTLLPTDAIFPDWCRRFHRILKFNCCFVLVPDLFVDLSGCTVKVRW